MKICQKNLVIGIVLVMGIFLCCTIYFEQRKSASLIELNAENNSALECVDSDLDLNEEIQIFSTPEVLSVVDTYSQHNHFHFTNIALRLFYPIWQPPKLS